MIMNEGLGVTRVLAIVTLSGTCAFSSQSPSADVRTALAPWEASYRTLPGQSHLDDSRRSFGRVQKDSDFTSDRNWRTG